MLRCQVGAEFIATAISQTDAVNRLLSKSIRQICNLISSALYEENVFSLTNFGPTPRESSLDAIAEKLEGI